ncbi:hypothetical protein ACJMK2_036312 [Sinanodonta woodiana]|uniref:Retinol dehydrogenase 13 n=1 Tax=Sinanodonta woodiana TaxID=1069815 RepID=A0ABD3WKW7_SINWO
MSWVIKLLQKSVFPLSAVGTFLGGSLILKDYLSGGKYSGDVKAYGKTVIVTGANTGIGKAVAKELAKRGARVILACRDVEKCSQAMADIYMESANRNLVCKKCDLASFASVRNFARSVCESERHIDILINNAGVMRCPKTYTENGLEMQMGVNHFGHFLLTMLLLDKMKASGNSRIINVTSIAHTRGEINFDDLNSAKHYDSTKAYEQSKLANMLFTNELARRLQGTNMTANAVYPGLCSTEIGRHMSVSKSVSGSFFSPINWLFLKSPTEGAQTIVYCALDPSLEKVSGKYFVNLKETESVPKANDEKVAKRLWAISEHWTHLNS